MRKFMGFVFLFLSILLLVCFALSLKNLYEYLTDKYIICSTLSMVGTLITGVLAGVNLTWEENKND